MEAICKIDGYEFTFSDKDVANPDDWIPAGEYNPHNVHPFLFHDHGFTVAVVFAGNLQDALDTLVDENKIDGFQIAPEDLKDYPDEEGITYLGNASEPFDIESLGVVEMPNPARSFAAQYAAQFPVKS